MRRSPRSAIRNPQLVPKDLCDSLLDCIGEMFYPQRRTTPAERKRWAQDRHWYRQRVITWAARWLDSRAVTLKPERFKQLLLDKLSDIKRNAPGSDGRAASVVHNWPRYIVHCIQDHFKHNGEAIYDEAKALTVTLENALDRAERARGEIDPIRILALAHQVNKPRKKPVAKPDNQPTLF